MNNTAARLKRVNSKANGDRVLAIVNRQRARFVSIQQLRKLAETILEEFHTRYELCIHLIATREMTRLNSNFLGHKGSTDVITFDYTSTPDFLRGEIFISISDAVKEAPVFQTTWRDEVARYLIHGVLHLRGYDDQDSKSREKMKRLENKLVRRYSTIFSKHGGTRRVN